MLLAPRSRRPRLLGVLAVAVTVVLALVLASTGPVKAHEGETVVPADGELLVGTPPQIRIQIPGLDTVELELRRADGSPVAFTGEIVRSDGLVVAVPPVLEPGTYILRWVHAGETDSSSFSIGEPSAVYTRSTLPSRGAATTVLAAALVVLALAAAALIRPRSARLLVVLTLTLPAAVVLTRWRGVLDVLVSAATAIGLAGAALTAGMLADVSRAPRTGTDRRRWLQPVSATAAALLVPIAAVALHGPGLGAPTLLAYASLALSIMLVAPLLATWLLAPASTGRTSGRAAAVVLTQALATVIAVVALGAGAPERIDALAGSAEDPAECLVGTNRLTIARCLDGSLVAIVERDGVGPALDTLRDLIGVNSRARFFCHEASHAVGRASLRINGNLADAFRAGYDVCDFGYYHGIVEGAAGGFDDATFLAQVPSLCQDFASAEELFYMQCNHGIGHAAARRTNNDMVRALEFCNALDKNPQLTGDRLRIARNGCGTGVTMEWFATATADPNAAVTPEVSEPRDVCTQIPSRWAPECVEYVGNTLDSSDPVNSLREIGRWCTTTGFDEACFRGVARAAAGVGIPPADAIAVCDTNAPTRDDCVSFYIAIVATTIDFDVSAVDRICAKLPERDRTGAFSLCERARQAVTEVLAATDGKSQG